MFCNITFLVILIIIQWTKVNSLNGLINYSNYQSNKLRYEKPDDCTLFQLPSNNIELTCSLRTINSEYDTTNFTVIPSENTASLIIVCDTELMVKSKLQPKSFAHLKQLKHLSIEYCKLDKLNESIFSGLNYLRNLSIRTFNINWPSFNLEIDSKTFLKTIHLEWLDLSLNNIWSLPENTFCSLSNLRSLNLSGNRLQDVNDFSFREKRTNQSSLTNGFSSCTFDLELLDASYNHFVLLPPFAFGALKHLKTLKVNNNEISMVADKAFEGLKVLKSVDLNCNKIVALPSELFREQRNSIEEIYLQDNKVAVLSPNLFSNLTQLQILDLSKNQLTSAWVNKNTFKELIRLVLLDLSYNQITKLDTSLFTDLFSLQVLNLCHNQIDTLTKDTFKMHNLHKLYLSHNNIKQVDAFSFNYLYTLNELAVDNNQISDIHQDAFRNCSALEKLHLNVNKLSLMPTFTNLHYLQELDLGENLLTKLEDSAFSGMYNLKGLRLINNKIQKLTKTMFIDLPNLQILNLAYNQITIAEEETFQGLQNLQAIRLDENKLTTVTNLFSNLTSLTWLNISGNYLTYLRYSDYSDKLLWLDLHKNQIQIVHPIMRNISLRTLDLSENEIRLISHTSFPNSIELLFLNDNLIAEIEAHTFLSKKRLLRVDLYANRLNTLNEKAFRLKQLDGKNDVPEFYIGGNPFVCDCNIEWLKNINNARTQTYPRIMDIDKVYCKLLHNRNHAYKQLTQAQPMDFLCEYNTHCFTLCQCCDFNACDCKMTCPQNCTCSHDQLWFANVVECTFSSYKEVPKIPMDTTELYIDGNDIHELPGHTFIGRKNLKVLFANNSNLQTIYNTSFYALKKLSILHLENNFIQYLNGSEFTQLIALTELYLHYNEIKFIDESTFSTLNDLSILRLDNNRLTNFEVWSLGLNLQLRKLNLAFNSWSCECSYMNKLKSYLNNNLQKIVDHRNISCLLNNIDVFILEKNTTKCIFRDGISSIITTDQFESFLPFLLVFTIIFLSLFALAALVICYKNELKDLMEDNCLCLSNCKNGTDDKLSEKDLCYDGFLIYSLLDNLYVNQNFSQALEDTCGYRLFLFHRDFDLELKKHVPDAVRDILDKSKRVLFILSTNFIYNEWSKYEIKGILHEVLQRQKKLIIILYGELPQSDLDADMRFLLRTNAVIEWDDKMFWQKMKIALPAYSKINSINEKKQRNHYEKAKRFENGEKYCDFLSNSINDPVRLDGHNYATINRFTLKQPNSLNKTCFRFLSSKDLKENIINLNSISESHSPHHIKFFKQPKLIPGNPSNSRQNESFEWISSASLTSGSESPLSGVSKSLTNLNRTKDQVKQDCINSNHTNNIIHNNYDRFLPNCDLTYCSTQIDNNCNERSSPKNNVNYELN